MSYQVRTNGIKTNNNGIQTNNNSSYTPYMSADERWVKGGGSVFQAPGVKKDSNSAAVANGESTTNDAEGRTDFCNNSSKELQDSQKTVEASTTRAKAMNRTANAKINSNTGKLNLLAQNSTSVATDIESLQSELDSLQTDDSTGGASAGGASNPFSVYSLNMPGQAGGADNKTGGGDNQPGGGLITGKQANQAIPPASDTEGTEGTENNENQERAEEITSEIEAKTKEQSTIDKNIKATAGQTNSIYKNNLKQMSLIARKDKQAQAAAKAAKDKALGETMKFAQTTQTIGGALTTSGQLVASYPPTSAVGAQMMTVGNYTTTAGSVLGAAASAEAGNANDTINSSTAAMNGVNNIIKQNKSNQPQNNQVA